MYRFRSKSRRRKKAGFKDIANEDWARDFEVEVTNIGDRPIYEFYLVLVLDVKDDSNQDVQAPLYYGRAELGDHRVHAKSTDVPLRPGESCFLKIHPSQVEAWDVLRRT